MPDPSSFPVEFWFEYDGRTFECSYAHGCGFVSVPATWVVRIGERQWLTAVAISHSESPMRDDRPRIIDWYEREVRGRPS